LANFSAEPSADFQAKYPTFRFSICSTHYNSDRTAHLLSDRFSDDCSYQSTVIPSVHPTFSATNNFLSTTKQHSNVTTFTTVNSFSLHAPDNFTDGTAN
jgi:hypothetical protein